MDQRLFPYNTFYSGLSRWYCLPLKDIMIHILMKILFILNYIVFKIALDDGEYTVMLCAFHQIDKYILSTVIKNLHCLQKEFFSPCLSLNYKTRNTSQWIATNRNQE